MPAVFERSGLRSRGEKSMWNLRPAGSIDLEGGGVWTTLPQDLQRNVGLTNLLISGRGWRSSVSVGSLALRPSSCRANRSVADAGRPGLLLALQPGEYIIHDGARRPTKVQSRH